MGADFSLLSVLIWAPILGGGLVLLAGDPEAVVARLLKRAEIEGRADDNEETIRERMRVYDAETAPLLDFYRAKGRLTEVSGMGSIEEVGKRIREALNV